MTRKAAIYVCISARQQDQHSQEPDLRRWAQVQKGQVAWYHDSCAGKTTGRPGMDRLLADLRESKIHTVVVWRLDRLGRTASGLAQLFRELSEHGANLVSLQDGLDLSTPVVRLTATVLASVSAYEAEVRAERVRAGQAAARAAGKRWGGSKKGRRLTVTDEHVAIAARMRGAGAKIAAIARATGLSRPTVYSILGHRGENAPVEPQSGSAGAPASL